MTQFDQKNLHLDKINTHAGDPLNSEIVAKVAWTELCVCVYRDTHDSLRLPTQPSVGRATKP